MKGEYHLRMGQPADESREGIGIQVGSKLMERIKDLSTQRKEIFSPVLGKHRNKENILYTPQNKDWKKSFLKELKNMYLERRSTIIGLLI